MISLFRLVLSSQGLRYLRALQLAIALLVVIGVGFNTYRLCTTAGTLYRAQAKLKQYEVIAKIDSSQSKQTINELGAVEKAEDYSSFMSTFICDVTQLARSTGCKLKTVNPQPIQSPIEDEGESVKFSPVQVDIQMSSTYASFSKFLDGLSRLPKKVVKVTRIELTRQSVNIPARKITLEAKVSLVLCRVEPPGKST